MRVVVAGATGNVGTSLLETLGRDERVESILGLARRTPSVAMPKVEWARVDISWDDLERHFRGADVVVHLAWIIQPSHHEDTLFRVNVGGSGRVFRAVADAGVPSLVYASSVGAYSPGPKDQRVDETWPTNGIPTSFYARHKAAVERRLDSFEAEHPDIRVVRLRKALVFKQEAAMGVRRLFVGPFVPTGLLAPRRIPAVPAVDRLVFQVVHTRDVADAYRRAILGDVRGAFNIAAEPTLDPPRLAELLDARTLPVPPSALRLVVDAAWRLHLVPTPPGWFDLAMSAPVMDTNRARQVLGWNAAVAAGDALLELLEGLHQRVGYPTPPLASAR